MADPVRCEVRWPNPLLQIMDEQCANVAVLRFTYRCPRTGCGFEAMPEPACLACYNRLVHTPGKAFAHGSCGVPVQFSEPIQIADLPH